MHQLLSEPKVRAYSNPGTAYGIGAPIPSPGGPMMSAPGGGYKGMSMAPPPQMGMMGSGSSYPSQGSPYGMVNSFLNKKYWYYEVEPNLSLNKLSLWEALTILPL